MGARGTVGYPESGLAVRFLRRRSAALAAAAIAVTLAGCSSGGSAAPSGPIEGSTTSATSADPSASLEAENAKVIAAYQAYLQAMVRLFTGGKADPKILEGTATPEAARHDAQQASLMFSSGGRMFGTVTTTPRSVEITGDTATLITCNDDSHWFGGKAGAAPTPGQTGGTPGLARVQLKRDGQRGWLFAGSEAAGAC